MINAPLANTMSLPKRSTSAGRIIVIANDMAAAISFMLPLTITLTNLSKLLSCLWPAAMALRLESRNTL